MSFSIFFVPRHKLLHKHSSAIHLRGVMINVVASSWVECGFDPRSGQTKTNIKKGICYFSAKHTALMQCCIEYTGLELTTLAVIGTGCTCSCKSNCYMAMTPAVYWS